VIYITHSNKINNIIFCFRDRVPTVLVKEWPLALVPGPCTMFNGDSIMGPVPTLFAENIEVIIYRLYLKQILINL
jgi:hypothetical protein